MATVNKLIVESQQTAAANTPEIFYTAPSNGLGTVITNFTAANDAGLTVSYKAYIVPAGGVAANAVVPDRSIVENRTDVPAELAAQMIPPGGTLQMETSSAGTISFTVSARELS